jgi:hypothetical protein
MDDEFISLVCRNDIGEKTKQRASEIENFRKNAQLILRLRSLVRWSAIFGN